MQRSFLHGALCHEAIWLLIRSGPTERVVICCVWYQVNQGMLLLDASNFGTGFENGWWGDTFFHTGGYWLLLLFGRDFLEKLELGRRYTRARILLIRWWDQCIWGLIYGLSWLQRWLTSRLMAEELLLLFLYDVLGHQVLLRRWYFRHFQLINFLLMCSNEALAAATTVPPLYQIRLVRLAVLLRCQ